MGRIIFVLIVTGVAHASDTIWRPLFNGQDLTGWSTWLGTPHASVELPSLDSDKKQAHVQPLGIDRDPTGVFSVVNIDGRSAIRISGQIFGGINTRDEFSNYHLRLQFKWGEHKWAPRALAVRDSGLLYHMHSEWNYNGSVWPRSLELQIQEQDVGDLYAVGCQTSVRARRLDQEKLLFQYDNVNGVLTEFIEQMPFGNRCIKGEDHEKFHGEGNTVEIICIGDQSIHIVNGVVVMRLRNARRLDARECTPLTSGHILLQSEGAEIYFRDIEIPSITSIPSEFLESDFR